MYYNHWNCIHLVIIVLEKRYRFNRFNIYKLAGFLHVILHAVLQNPWMMPYLQNTAPREEDEIRYNILSRKRFYAFEFIFSHGNEEAVRLFKPPPPPIKPINTPKEFNKINIIWFRFYRCCSQGWGCECSSLLFVWLSIFFLIFRWSNPFCFLYSTSSSPTNEM